MRLIFWTVFLFIIWVALTMSFSNQELITGFVVSFILALLYVRNYKSLDTFRFQPIMYLSYLVVFLKNLVLSNIDVARRVIDPKLPINPGIVAIKTALQEDYKKLILANSITLTPGTITLDVQEDTLYIHWIDVRTADMKEAGEIIAGDFEHILLK
ncbi:Na+/H+ antiporter subunit E [Sulfurospirillum sp. 1612]|uniref:Na+/H+ antiporter subunit E n=1 Tax=Sulfurospirillum sp. 1612 TaxID=3094835 RepID=UPI002F91CB44